MHLRFFFSENKPLKIRKKKIYYTDLYNVPMWFLYRKKKCAIFFLIFSYIYIFFFYFESVPCTIFTLKKAFETGIDWKLSFESMKNIVWLDWRRDRIKTFFFFFQRFYYRSWFVSFISIWSLYLVWVYFQHLVTGF